MLVKLAEQVLQNGQFTATYSCCGMLDPEGTTGFTRGFWEVFQNIPNTRFIIPP